MKNQTDYYRAGTKRNEAWTKVATMKNSSIISRVKGKVKGKTIKLCKQGETVEDVEWTKKDFMRVISKVKDSDDPIFNSLNELLSALEELDDFDILSEYVKEIYDICKKGEQQLNIDE